MAFKVQLHGFVRFNKLSFVLLQHNQTSKTCLLSLLPEVCVCVCVCARVCVCEKGVVGADQQDYLLVLPSLLRCLNAAFFQMIWPGLAQQQGVRLVSTGNKFNLLLKNALLSLPKLWFVDTVS